MLENLEDPSTHVRVVPAAPEHEPIIANLLELYAHDFSEFNYLELGADGRFGYQTLSLYWKEPDHYPFLVRVDGRLAGFALVKRRPLISETEPSFDMAEFFIVRAYRRQRLGTEAAHQLWRMFPGPWVVRVMESNRAAVSFWQRAIATFWSDAIHPDRIEKDGKWWYVFVFQCRQAV